MKTIRLYNLAHPLAETAKPIFLPFGEWPYDAKLRQRLTPEAGARIANELNARVARGEPGIPVYQGHPDVPALAPKYPDKGALGWVTRIDLANSSDGRAGLVLTVDWDRDPGAGFKWFSPYWFGPEPKDGTVLVNEIASIGLVNNPNISEFRLPNEAEDHINPEDKENTMNREELIQMLGLPPEATDDQIKAAIADLKKAGEAQAAAEQKAAAAEETAVNACAESAAAKEKCETATNECCAAKKELENCRRELANEKAEHAKLKALKTQSATTGLANSANTLSSPRMALVNEIQRAQGLTFDAAWAAAKTKNPELFK